jgi:hypothetical protein
MMKMLAEYSERISEEIGKRSEVKVAKMPRNKRKAMTDEGIKAGVLLVEVKGDVVGRWS